MDVDIVERAQDVMRAQTKKNNAPAWELTVSAVENGVSLARVYGADARLVAVALYLAHTIFDDVPKSETQRDHVRLSAAFAAERLMEWGVQEHERDIVLNAIRAHHGGERIHSIEAEVVRNAECQKFLTVENAKTFLADLARRGMSSDDAASYLREKMAQKRALLTFPASMRDADEHIDNIERTVLSPVRSS